jgi:hypothetical protein
MDAFTSGVFILCLRDHALGRTSTPAGLIGGAVLALPRLLFATVAYLLIVTLGFVACVIPGLLAMAQLSLCQVIAVLEPGRGPIGTSFTTVHGRLLLGPAVLMIITLGSYAGLAIASQLVTVYVTHGTGEWAVSLSSAVARGLVGTLADAMLFCIWLRLRHPQQHTVA